MMYNNTSADRNAGHYTAEKTFSDYIVEHGSLSAIALKYGHQKNFWQKVTVVCCRKGLELRDRYFVKSPYKTVLCKSKNTGKFYVEYQ